ncbi:MAG: hypothetical protein P1V20_17125 [Verrucomicrobiales bacterium]|nr:hypothetical protein [Verrucomicrobiales bacterium]
MKGILFTGILFVWFAELNAQETGRPLDLHTFPLREEMKLIVEAAASHSSAKACFSTTRGEIWIVNNPLSESSKFSDYGWQRFANGLREPGQIIFRDAHSIVAQQSVETTRVTDRDKNGVADEYLAVGAGELPSGEVKTPFEGMIWMTNPEPAGPFKGQYFGGSRTANFLSRLGRVDDSLGSHSAMFVFQEELVYPVDAIIRMENGSWLIAQSNRSDPERTRTKFALQRASWNKTEPFEVLSIRATEAGFHLSFTKKLLPDTAGAEWAYRIESMEEKKESKITSIKVEEDEMSVSLECSPVVPGMTYHISCNGVWSIDRDPVRNPAGLFVFEKPNSAFDSQ